MPNHQKKQIANLEDSLLLHQEPLQQQDNLYDTTQQKNQHYQSKPSTFQPNQKETLNPDQADDLYVQKQHFKIQDDLQDFNDLESQIQRLKKIKNEYKEQKQSIEKLSKVVQTLKSENRSLKLQKESNKDDSATKYLLHQMQENLDPHDKHGKRILTQNVRKGIKGNIVNRNLTQKVHLGQNAECQRFMSPQSHRRIFSNNIKNLGQRSFNLEENHMNGIFRTDQQIMLKNHQQNKKSVIASFVEELKQELQQNEIILQKQKRSHRETRQRLEACLQQLVDVRLLIDGQRNFELIERENSQMKRQFQSEIKQRKLVEQRLRENEMILSQYEGGLVSRCSQFDRELDRMDEIYFSLERTLKF